MSFAFGLLALGLVALGVSACAGAKPSAAAHSPEAGVPPIPADAASIMDAVVPPARTDGAVPSSQGDAAQVTDAAAADGGTSGGSLGAFDAGSLTPSHGGTITFQEIGAAGWFPSRRDPASGECSAYETATCCMTRHEITSDALTPWDEDLIMTLRGPIVARQIAIYQPRSSDANEWTRVAAWDGRSPQAESGLSFDGEASAGALSNSAFAGTVGDQCLVDVASDQPFPCGPGSVPYCPATDPDQPKHYGWSGSKLIVMLLSMPHAEPHADDQVAIDPAQHCGNDAANNWYDAPWIGFSHGELVRSGKFGDCHCYAKDPAQWLEGDGCGQLNAFEVVNDNNQAKNLNVFSTNFFGYQGYIGEGPCGGQCDTSALSQEIDLIDKSTSQQAAQGALATPSGGPGAAFVRPSHEPRYFIVLFDIATRTVQLAIVSPARIPSAAAPLLPELPERIARDVVEALTRLRLPG